MFHLFTLNLQKRDTIECIIVPAPDRIVQMLTTLTCLCASMPTVLHHGGCKPADAVQRQPSSTSRWPMFFPGVGLEPALLGNRTYAPQAFYLLPRKCALKQVLLPKAWVPPFARNLLEWYATNTQDHLMLTRWVNTAFPAKKIGA